jgi:tetratricopeptide (TPR) repeat protein
MPGTIENYERAYAAFRHRPDPIYPAGVALRIGFHCLAHLAHEAAAAGWFARAQRLIEEHELEGLRGELLLMQACDAEDPAFGEARVREALELARRSGDLDLELCSLSWLGVSLIEQGGVVEGMPLLDEAMAGSLGGEAGRLDTVVFTSCNLMTSCARCAAFELATQWVRAAERFVRQYGCPFLYVECRTVYGAVLLATGDWIGAEEELKTAIELSRDSVPAYYARATATLAELRLAQGRIGRRSGW